MPKPIRVLIADDNEDFVDIFRHYLASFPDIDIIGVARTGMQAYMMTLMMKPDVLILDLIMPDMEGLEALQRIRSLGEKAPIIIALSGLSDDMIIKKARTLGAERYYIKPYIENIAPELRLLTR